MSKRLDNLVLPLAFTAILIGYLSVWQAAPAAGLSLLGIEMGEWYKFAGLGPRRDIFYLPPIMLSLLLSLWTMTWPRNDWRAWAMRGVAVLVALLAFPAIGDLTGTAREEYTMRLQLVAQASAVALISGVWRPRGWLSLLPWGLMLLVGLTGLIWPTQLFLEARDYATNLFGTPVGIGIGVWLNGIGHLAVSAVAGLKLISGVRQRQSGAGNKRLERPKPNSNH